MMCLYTISNHRHKDEHLIVLEEVQRALRGAISGPTLYGKPLGTPLPWGHGGRPKQFCTRIHTGTEHAHMFAFARMPDGMMMNVMMK